jgi:hypothetical protein
VRFCCYVLHLFVSSVLTGHVRLLLPS